MFLGPTIHKQFQDDSLAKALRRAERRRNSAFHAVRSMEDHSRFSRKEQLPAATAGWRVVHRVDPLVMGRQVPPAYRDLPWLRRVALWPAAAAQRGFEPS
jgi:hypothetical protein